MVFRFQAPSFCNDDLEVHPPVVRTFSLSELRSATKNFSNCNLLGRGAFGKVFRGRLLDGSAVAVKKLHGSSDIRAETHFQTEIKVGGLGNHPNLLPLLGYCTSGEERLLVYPLLINKSLASHLGSDSRRLSWLARKRIALGTARALAYLHDGCSPRIIHRRVSSSNILLDGYFEAVLGDFSLAIIKHEKDIMSRTIESSDDITCHLYEDTYLDKVVRGQMRWIAPEYLCTGKCTEKSDVFSYGNVLLELITGKMTSHICRLIKEADGTLMEWLDRHLRENSLENMVDSNLRGNYDEGEAKQLVQLALLCLDRNPAIRPKMSEVVKMLEAESQISVALAQPRLSLNDNDSTPYYSFPSSPAEWFCR